MSFDVSPEFCLFLVPYVSSMLRPLVCTMHFIKRYWILKSDEGFQSQLCSVMWSVVCVVCNMCCCVLCAFRVRFTLCLLGLVVLWGWSCGIFGPLTRGDDEDVCVLLESWFASRLCWEKKCLCLG